MTKKIKILSEDNQMLYNKWVSGIAKGESPSSVITVDDIINRHRNKLNNHAPKILPYPLNFLLDSIGNVFVKAAEIRRTLIDSSKYPLLKEDPKKTKSLESLNRKMKQIQDILYSCTEELNILVEDRKNSIK